MSPHGMLLLFIWCKSKTFRNYVMANRNITWCKLFGDTFRYSNLHVQNWDLKPLMRQLKLREPSTDFLQCLNSLFVLLENENLQGEAQRELEPFSEEFLACNNCRFSVRQCKLTHSCRVEGAFDVRDLLERIEKERTMTGRCANGNTHRLRSKVEIGETATKGLIIDTRRAVLTRKLSKIRKGLVEFYPSIVVCRSSSGRTLFYHSSQPNFEYHRIGDAILPQTPSVVSAQFIFYERLERGQLNCPTPPRPPLYLPRPLVDRDSDSEDDEDRIAAGTAPSRALVTRERVEVEDGGVTNAVTPATRGRRHNAARLPLPPPPRTLRGNFVPIPSCMKTYIREQMRTNPILTGGDNNAKEEAYKSITEYIHGKRYKIRPKAVRDHCKYLRSKMRDHLDGN